MYCLNLLGKRLLQPAKKAWKTFTGRIHSRLNRSKSKAIKKPKNRIKTATKSVSWPTLAFKPRLLQSKTRTMKTTCNLHLHKKAEPVYIDQLFKESLASSLKNHYLQPPATGETTKESVERGTAADDMWESLGLASPLMHEINERAEEYITRVHAEMQLQEMIAHRL